MSVIENQINQIRKKLVDDSFPPVSKETLKTWIDYHTQELNRYLVSDNVEGIGEIYYLKRLTELDSLITLDEKRKASNLDFIDELNVLIIEYYNSNGLRLYRENMRLVEEKVRLVNFLIYTLKDKPWNELQEDEVLIWHYFLFISEEEYQNMIQKVKMMKIDPDNYLQYASVKNYKGWTKKQVVNFLRSRKLLTPPPPECSEESLEFEKEVLETYGNRKGTTEHLYMLDFLSKY